MGREIYIERRGVRPDGTRTEWIDDSANWVCGRRNLAADAIMRAYRHRGEEKGAYETRPLTKKELFEVIALVAKECVFFDEEDREKALQVINMIISMMKETDEDLEGYGAFRWEYRFIDSF